MEGAALEANTAPDVSVKPASMACLRRQAWAHSKDSIWQEPEPRSPPRPPRSQSTTDTLRPSEEPGQNPNKIASWLIECSTPLGPSFDDASPPPNKGALRNGCSFEDDLSLGAEANHLLSGNNKTESRFSLVADQKRSQYKERGRSMNSTGSGKSSTVSSVSVKLEQSDEQPAGILLTQRVSELLDLYEEDPEEILFNLGFGREEPDLNAKIPSRFFNNSSVARGIDIKVYLKAQLQRMELENPNYALTSRFRQIEVLTTVANEFFQLYSQVSGQPVQRISSKDQATDSEGGDEGRSDEKPPLLKKTNSALNVAKLLKKTITKHNLLAASPESPLQTNGCTAAVSNHAVENGLAPAAFEQEGEAAESDHKAEAGGQKLVRKKDNCSLATVTEESGGDVEPDLLSHDSLEQSTGAEHQVDSAEFQTLSQTSGQEVAQVDQSAPTVEKAPRSLTPPHLAQLRIENTDSFDMEEIQSNEDEALPPRTSRAADLSRTVSQQSDSSGFAEEPSADSCSSLKLQESSDSCDSETTVTSHPSQDLATPVALDQPGFVLPDTRQGEVGPHDAAEVDGRSKSVEEEQMKLSPGQFPQYMVHQLPKLLPSEERRDESLDEDRGPKAESEVNQCVSAAEEETLPEETEDPKQQSVSEPDPQPTEKLSETVLDVSPSTEANHEQNGDLQESIFLDNNNQLCPPAPSCQVLSALNRAKQGKLSQMGQRIEPAINEMPLSPRRGGSHRSGIRLQRSSSLPSSLLSPSRMVSTIKIQVGRGQGSSSQARFSVKYTQEDGQGQEVEQEQPANVLSTLIINPGPSSSSHKTQTAIPPKPIPSHLMRSCCSLQSSSPPPEWTPEGQSWSTRSVPDLTSDQQPFNHSPLQNMSTNQNLTSWNQNFALPSQCPSAQYIPPSSSQYTSPSPRFNFSPCPFPQQTHPLPQQHPYSSLPNLFHHQHPSMVPQSGHHTPLLPPQHQSMSNLHQAPNSMLPYHVGPAHPHPGNPMMQSQGYNHPYANPSPYNTTPLGAQSAPQYLSYQGYVNSFSHPVSQYPPPLPQHLNLEHSIYPGLAPLAPGFHPGHGSAYHQGYNFHSGLVNSPGPASRSGQGLSSTEIQLRRVLHEIRGTIQSLIENRVNTPDVFSEHQAAHSSLQSLSEFQQKRRSLNLFRRQMMDLEMSITQQQALVYNQLSPADRMEMEKLQYLRSSVREELQELEQQLEEKLMDMIHSTQHGGFRSNCSVDNLSTVSALRAMEPMSELLSEQFYLQSELNYDSHESSAYPFSRSSSPFRGRGAGGDGKQKQELYRTSVDITPSLPSRPNTHHKGKPKEEEESDCGGVEGEAAGKGDASEQEEEDGATGEVTLDNLQQLIKEIRESVAQEVRKEIYSELLSAVTMQQSPVSARKHYP